MINIRAVRKKRDTLELAPNATLREVACLPSNKIGGLKAGQGVRRIQAQREGGWRDEDAKRTYEIGAEFRPERRQIDMPSRSSRWSGQND